MAENEKEKRKTFKFPEKKKKNVKTIAFTDETNPIVEVQIGPHGRVEWLRAKIKKCHLTKGTPVSVAARKWVKFHGHEYDESGHIIGKELGGRGDCPYNIFPQNYHINRGISREQEKIIKQTLTGGTVEIDLEFEYRGDSARPDRIYEWIKYANGSEQTSFTSNEKIIKKKYKPDEIVEVVEDEENYEVEENDGVKENDGVEFQWKPGNCKPCGLKKWLSDDPDADKAGTSSQQGSSNASNVNSASNANTMNSSSSTNTGNSSTQSRQGRHYTYHSRSVLDYIPVVGSFRSLKHSVEDFYDGNIAGGSLNIVLGLGGLALDAFTLGTAGTIGTVLVKESAKQAGKVVGLGVLKYTVASGILGGVVRQLNK